MNREPRSWVIALFDSAWADRRDRPGTRELWIAAALTLGVGLLYGLTFQTRYYGDGPSLTTMHVLGTRVFHTHLLYLPVCDLVARVVGTEDPLLALRLVSIVPAALGCGLAFLLARTLGAPVFGALAATLLLALSPALWFFGTTIEVHALTFGATSLVALVTLLAPWRCPALGLGIAAVAFLPLFWVHESAIVLGPGCVLLVQYARARQGPGFSWRALLFCVGPVLLLALCLSVAGATLARGRSVAAVVEHVRTQLAVPGRQLDVRADSVLLREWLQPLGVLVPLALLGARRLRAEAWRAPAIAVLVLFPLGFFAWWSVLERGGYFLGSDAFLLVPVALLFGAWSRAKGLLALLLLTGQATLARARIEAFDQGWVPAERVAQVRAALGDSGLLLSSVGFAPSIRIDLPGIEEFSTRSFVRSTCLRENRLVPPEEIVAALRPCLRRLFERHERVAFETGFHRVTSQESPSLAACAPSLTAIEDLLREHYRTSKLAHPDWGLLVLERPERALLTETVSIPGQRGPAGRWFRR